MKKLLTIAIMTAAVSALAVESSNTFGILRVDSTAAQTIVSVPWLAAGGGAIKVKDVVKTANLTPASEVDPVYIGDQLYYYANGTYKMWRLTSNGWEGANIVANGIDSVTKGSDSDELTRGGAIILVRKDPSQSFYLYGQYQAIGSSEKTDLAAGSASSVAYSLIAPPVVNDNGKANLNDFTWTGIGASDIIIRSDMTTFYYNSLEGRWGTRTVSLKPGQGVVTEWNYDVATIDNGIGAWFVSSTAGSPSVKWSK